MSKFSEKCKELLIENGYNVYRLSQAASLERTTLQRMVTGKRLPGPEFVEHFCQALRISLPEKKEIMELYKNDNSTILEISTNSKGKISNVDILKTIILNLE